MDKDTIKRVSRLISIATQLQTKRLITAVQLSEKFNVSIRTIYRDIKALERAGIPVLTAEGKGYSLMEGYRIPPVMFTENEANALATAEQLIVKGKESSLNRELSSAVSKVKAVLQYSTKEKNELLSGRIAMSPIISNANPSNSLMLIQNALTSFKVLEIVYHSQRHDQETLRQVEPFAFYYSLEENWLLIAYCRLREDFRMFRLDRVSKIKILEAGFEPHKLTLAEYLEEKKKNFTTPDIPLS